MAECVELILVDTLIASLEGEPGEYPVDALRKDDTLYLTPKSGNVTEFVSDYIFDDRYDEGREDEDAQTLATFVAAGCSQDPPRLSGHCCQMRCASVPCRSWPGRLYS